MRRGLGLAIAVVASTLALVGPTPSAVAGNDGSTVVRQLDEVFDVAGFDCTGAPGAAPEARLGFSDHPDAGLGTATLRSDALGGLLWSDPRHPARTRYHVRAPKDAVDPQAMWRITVDDQVLTSDPFAITPGWWSAPTVQGTTLHDGDGWSGYLLQYFKEFGHGEHVTVGLLTGGCLNSPDVQLDSIGRRHSAYNLEPRVWLTLTGRRPDGRHYLGQLEYGRPFQLTAKARRYEDGRAVPVASAHVVLEKRPWGQDGKWRAVDQARTDEHGEVAWKRTAERATLWRAVWRRSPHDVPVGDETAQGADTVFMPPRVNGAPCRVPDPDRPSDCARITVDQGIVTVTGRMRPARSARISLEVRGDIVAKTRGRADGTWRLTFPSGPPDRTYVYVHENGVSPAHWASDFWILKLTVRR